jgi:hypothetical protein
MIGKWCCLNNALCRWGRTLGLKQMGGVAGEDRTDDTQRQQEPLHYANRPTV